jgi:hypothetical protein
VSTIQSGVLMTVSGISVAGAVGAYSLTPTPSTKVAPIIGSSNLALSSASAPQSAFTLTRSIPVTQNVIYSRLAALNSDSLAWAIPPTDDISQLLAMGLKAHLDSASLLGGLGAQLLDRVATTQSDFRQAVVIDVHSSGKLSAAEQAAIAKLSKGFDAALQGITSGSTKVDVSGLVNYDTTVLSGVDLKVRESPQMSSLRSLDFHADASRRSFSMQGQAGIVSVSVDLSAPALWESPAQQQTAVLRYLDQFDAANRRAHGGATLLGQFKDAFAQLNSSYPALDQQPAHALTASVLNGKDRSVLSGLADFQASMSGDFNNGSATHFTTEAGHIDYEVSQATETRGVAKRTGLSVVQTQASKLGASFAASRNGAMLDIASGDYDIYTFKDSASTSTSFEYADDKLQSAASINRVNQSEIYGKLVNQKIVAQKSTPHSVFTIQDISAQLRPTL